VAEILVHSTLVKHFDTSGWPVEIRKVHQLYPGQATSVVLGRTWETYKARFIHAGRVIDPGRNGDTTSEGQSYALLRAVYMNDRPTFEAVWGWTKTNLQRPEGTFAWLYGERAGGAAQVVDQGTASDGDQDTALALLLASRRWSEPTYQGEALTILGGIWDHETAFVGNQSVLVAGDWARGGNGQPAVVNPSYFAPYAYRIFQQADPTRPWITLVDSSYAILASFAQDDRLGARSGMLPTWVALDPQTGTPSIATGMQDADTFGYDGLRAPWRLSLDWLWYRDTRAQQALLRFRSLGQTLTRDGKIVAAYATDGTPRAGYESIAMYAGVVPGMLFSGEPEAWAAFDLGIQRRYVDDGHTAYWGDPNNYYDQNWAWFSTALLDGALGNLWEGHERLDWSGLIIN
jgi:endoglucanase